jgi:hypothetical protein
MYGGAGNGAGGGGGSGWISPGPTVVTGNTQAIVPQTVAGNTVTGTVARGAAVSPTSISSSITTLVNQRVTNITNSPGNSTPGGIQFYGNGEFSSDKDFTYSSGSDILTVSGKILAGNISISGLSKLGNVGNVSIAGGTIGQVLQTNGDGTLTWTTIYANSNVSSYLPTYTGALTANTATFNRLNVTGNANLAQINTLNVTGNGNNLTVGVTGSPNVLTITNTAAVANIFTSNNFVLGNSTTTISTNRWLDAVTMSTNPAVLFTAPNTISSVDIHITADDGTSKQITKMLSVTKGTTTSYSQYGNVLIGTEMASYYMDQLGGLVRVIAQPSSSNRVDYRLVVTLYN